MKLPEGDDTVVGERGDTLSRGQRQRIAIARAIVRDSPIILLDEPSAALDPESEELIFGAMTRLREGRTTITIAHGLATVRRADAIVVLDGGRIVERDAHEELLAVGAMRTFSAFSFAAQARHPRYYRDVKLSVEPEAALVRSSMPSAVHSSTTEA